MSKLISEFNRILPQLQAREIEKELLTPEAQLRFGGDIDAARAELQRQLRLMLESDTSLRFSPIELKEDNYRDSETINWMVDKVATDLNSLFAESDQLAKIQAFNEKFFREEIIQKIEQAVNELDNELDRLELLSGRFNGLTDGIAENFRVDGQRLNRAERSAHLALVDPKTNSPLAVEQEMPVNLAIGGLTLPPDVNAVIGASRITDIQSSDTLEEDSPFALLSLSTPSSAGEVRETGRIWNLIDRRESTAWTKAIKAKVQEGGAKLNLVLDFAPGPVKANYIQITPAYNSSHTLIYAGYTSPDNTSNELYLPDGGVDFNGKIILPFPVSVMKRVCLVFAQEDYRRSPNEAPGVVEYTFSLAEIQVGMTEFKQLGYYVTKTLSLPLISQLYLSAETNGNLLSFAEGEDTAIPTIEYWVAYRDIDEADNVLFNTYIPILPVEKQYSYEKLVLNERDEAHLMFKVKEDITNADEDTLQVIRDSDAILRPIDYTIKPSGDTLATPTVLSIQNGFNVQKEYYARYNPLHLDMVNRPVPFLDRTGLIEYLSDSSIKISRQENSRAVRSEVNLIVLIRGTEDRKRTLAIDRLIFGVG